jgi:hypothetical protein
MRKFRDGQTSAHQNGSHCSLAALGIGDTEGLGPSLLLAVRRLSSLRRVSVLGLELLLVQHPPPAGHHLRTIRKSSGSCAATSTNGTTPPRRSIPCRFPSQSRPHDATDGPQSRTSNPARTIQLTPSSPGRIVPSPRNQWLFV